MEPEFAFAYLGRASLCALKGLRSEALADVEAYYRLTKDECGYRINQAELEALFGKQEESPRTR